MSDLTQLFGPQHSALKGILDARNELNSKFTGLAGVVSANQFNKSGFWNYGALGEIRAMSKMMQQVTKVQFPLFDDHLKNIQSNHIQIFDKLSVLAGVLPSSPILSQLKSMQSVMNNLALHYAKDSIRAGRIDLLEDFDEITGNVTTITDRVSDQQAVTKTDLKELKKIINRIDFKIDQKDRTAIDIILRWMTIIGFILTMLQESRQWLNSDNQVSKTDLEEFKMEFKELLNEKLVVRDDVRIVEQTCNLRLKPSSRTLVIGTVEMHEEVIVLVIQGKWAYVRMADNPTLHGWIFKKYLTRKS